jgi:hypothetical protein
MEQWLAFQVRGAASLQARPRAVRRRYSRHSPLKNDDQTLP